MKKVFFLFLSVALAHTLSAQVVYDYLKGADDYFKNGDYFSAVTYYEKYLGVKGGKRLKTDAGITPYAAYKGTGKKASVKYSTKEQAMYNLAESYRMLHYHTMAEPAYQECLKFDKAQFPLTRYWYASTLRSLGKYGEAEAALKQFIDEYPQADTYKENATRELKNLTYIQEQMKRKDLALYKVAKTSGDLPDSGAAVYAPYLDNGYVYYTSTVADSKAPKNQQHNNRVYQGTYNQQAVSAISKIDMPEDEGIQQGVVSISKDSYIMYITRWTISKGKKQSYLCRSIRKGNTWSKPDPIVSGINVEGYSSQQGFVMPDGKHIIFSSNQPGGMGGFDLWAAPIDENGREGAPFNLGSKVNTPGDEQAPFYHQSTGTLVFSSNGRVGMGGYDFFYSKGKIGDFAEPFNLGYPVNSAKDDIYFASRQGTKELLEDVLLSSDRNDVCCLEMFSLHKDRLPRRITGRIVSCADESPLANVAVEIRDSINNKTVTTLTTDEKGAYTFTLDDFAPLLAKANKDGYFSRSLEFNGPADVEEIELMNPSLCMTLIPTPNPIIFENVYFDYDRYDIKPAAYPELDRMVKMMTADTTLLVEITAHADGKGTDEYNQKLSENRAASVVNYLVSKGVRKSSLTSIGMGKSQPVAPNENPDGTDNPEGRQKNRRVEAKVTNK